MAQRKRRSLLPQWLELIHATLSIVPNSPLFNADAVTRFFSSLWQFSFHSLLLSFYIFILCNTAFAFAFGTETFVRFAFIETKDEGKEKNTIKNVRMHV